MFIQQERLELPFFGEGALYRNTPRLARVRCLTDCRLLRLAREDFDTLTEDDPDFRAKIEAAVSERQPAAEDLDPHN